MEKRRNTLDRWQRLRFGRRAASNPPEDKKASNLDSDAQKRSSDKTERLRELTELLKVSRAPTSPTTTTTTSTATTKISLKDPNTNSNETPPIPPPRRHEKRNPSLTNSGSIEKFIDTSASESGSPILNTKFDHSKDEQYQRSEKRDSQPMLPLPEENSLFKVCEASNETNTPTRYPLEVLPRAESKPIVGSYQQKAIPFRSASFSQIDYSSGKYIRSALGALKASLSKSKSPPAVEGSNLPLPRQDRSRSTSPEPNSIAINENTNIWIPLKPPCDKRNDLNLDLLDAAATSNIIMEEDNENSPISDHKDKHFNLPVSKIPPPPPPPPTQLKMLKAAQTTINSPCEEGLSMQPMDNYFQTATTCLIPVPVYECARNESENLHLADKWINACEIDSSKILDEIQKISTPSGENEIPAFAEIQANEDNSNKSKVDTNNSCDHTKSKKRTLNADKLRRKTQSPTLDIDELPSIAVTPGSSISNSSFEEAENSTSQPMQRSDTGSDYVVELRKRYSNEDKSNSNENRSSGSNQSTSTSGSNSPKSNLDEKRRIDKSKRRKGIYIQWAALDKHNKELSAVSWSGGNVASESSGKFLPEMLDADLSRSEIFSRY